MFWKLFELWDDPNRRISKVWKILDRFPVWHEFNIEMPGWKIAMLTVLWVDSKNYNSLILEYKCSNIQLSLSVDVSANDHEEILRQAIASNDKISKLFEQTKWEVLWVWKKAMWQIQTYMSPFWSQIAVSSDKWVLTKKNDKNADRAGVLPSCEFATVVDWIWFWFWWDKCAHCLTEHLLEYPEDPQRACDESLMNTPGPWSVFVSARIAREAEKIFVEASYAWDATLIIFDESWEVFYVLEQDSFVNMLVEKGAITADQALYDPRRNQVTNKVTRGSFTGVKTKKIEVKSWYRLILMSDWNASNFTLEEIAKLVRWKNAKQANKAIIEEGWKRLKNFGKITKWFSNKDREKNGVYPDWYRTEPSNDNRTCVVMDVA